MVTINIQKKDLYLISVIIVFLFGIGFVIAWGGTSPSLHGHDLGELALPSCSNGQMLQKTATGWDCGSGAGGGGVFTRWGNSNCPSGTTLLNSGVAFNGYFGTSHAGGGGSAICIKSGDPGSDAGAADIGTLLYPVASAASNVPPGITISKEIKCSICYSQNSVFEIYGTSACPSGWTAAYTGYTLGNHFAYNPSERHCVDNVNFDSSTAAFASPDYWYGSFIDGSSDIIAYPIHRYIKCAVCVKQ